MKKFTSDLWTGLRTGPARAGLAFCSLGLGLFAVTILLATLEALQRQARDLVRSFGAGSFVLVRSSDAPPETAWNRRHVEWFRANAGPEAVVSGIKVIPAAKELDVTVVTADAHLARVRGWHFSEGRVLDGLDVRQGARRMLVPAGMCREKGWHAGDLVPLGPFHYRLTGCYDSGGAPIPLVPEDAVIIPYTADLFEPDGKQELERVDALLFRAGEGLAPEVLQQRVAALLKQPGMSDEVVEWIKPESLLQGIRRWQRAIAWTAGSGGALSLLLGAVTLAGMLLTGIRERITEIGLRRALGARRREIAGLFVAESLVLTGAAAGAGMLAAEGMLHWLGGRFPLPFHFGAGTRLVPLVLAGGLALVCSIGPAWMAARLPPAEALRNE